LTLFCFLFSPFSFFFTLLVTPLSSSTFLNLLVAHLIERLFGDNSEAVGPVPSPMLFSTGGTTAPVTNGIAACCLSKEGWGSLMLLDTEGLGMGSKAGLDRLVTFALLVSSNLILNTTRSLTETTLHQLEVITAVGQKIGSAKDGLIHCPSLQVLLQDALELDSDTPQHELQRWLDSSNPARDLTNDDVRSAINLMFETKSMQVLPRITTPGLKVLNERMESGGTVREWSSKLRRLEMADSEFFAELYEVFLLSFFPSFLPLLPFP
jgi:hypothetical protein